ncbi:hypothetical protein GCM10023238_13810 [Streptomyces heliomycini]
MSTVDILSPAGEKTVASSSPRRIFGVEKISIPLIHQVVVAQNAAAARHAQDQASRRGPWWRQEPDTARRAPAAPVRARPARRSSRRGGVVHGPVPRDYSQRTPKKMKAAALRHALTDRRATTAFTSSPA